MKNIQIIDGAENCTYDIFSIDEMNFEVIFPDGQDIEFAEDLQQRLGLKNTNDIFNQLWKNKADKKTIDGIHGTLFFQGSCLAEWILETAAPLVPVHCCERLL